MTPGAAVSAAGCACVEPRRWSLAVQPAHRVMQWAPEQQRVYIIGLGVHFILLRDTSKGLAWTLLACCRHMVHGYRRLFCGSPVWQAPILSPPSARRKLLRARSAGLPAGVMAAVLVFGRAACTYQPAERAAVGLSAQVSPRRRVTSWSRW